MPSVTALFFIHIRAGNLVILKHCERKSIFPFDQSSLSIVERALDEE
jgi:hypothetical protein